MLLLVLRQHLIFGYVVVDLAKDPSTAGPLARSTTLIFNVDAELVGDSARMRRVGVSLELV